MEYHGINGDLIKQYITFKRSIGYALDNNYTFKMFDRFTIEQGGDFIGLTRELADNGQKNVRTNQMLHNIKG